MTAELTQRVLVVDNDADIVEALALLLTLEGFEVMSAHDGAEALRVEADFQPDVIILDLEMPSLDGLEVANRIRAVRRNRRQRIYLVTGRPDAKNMRGPASPFDEVFIKPVEATLLIRHFSQP